MKLFDLYGNTENAFERTRQLLIIARKEPNIFKFISDNQDINWGGEGVTGTRELAQIWYKAHKNSF